jgi:transposase
MELQSELRMESTRLARPIEVMVGSTGRRCWPDALKARIVAETLQPGSRVREVASRYGLLPHHLSAWRSMARKGTLVLAEADMPAFVPVALQDNADAGPVGGAPSELRISVADVTLHMPATFPVTQAAALVAALRAAL